MTLPRQPCNALQQYELFSSTSIDPPRLWTRAESSGRESCCKPGLCLISAKLKQRVLERTQDNNGSGVIDKYRRNEIASFATMTNPNLTRHVPSTNIRIANVMYYIPPEIYSLIPHPLPTTLSQLQQLIAHIRSTYHIPTKSLQAIPLSQYKKRYVYNENNKKWKYEQDKDASLTRNYSIAYSVLNLVNVPELNVFNNMPFLGAFAPRHFQTQNAQYITVVQNTGCSFTNKIKDLFPKGVASFWGNELLPVVSIDLYYKNGSTLFYPEFVIVKPQSWDIYGGANPVKFGMLIGMNTPCIDYIKSFLSGTILIEFENMLSILLPQLNSELIFIPIQNEVELIQNVNYKPSTGIIFPITSGGIITKTSLIEFNKKAMTYYQTKNPNYKLLRNNLNIPDFVSP